MKQFAVLCLTSLTLLACSDNDSTPVSPPATQETGNPLVGAWQNGEQILVLEENGDFYLPADEQRQGLTWENNDGTFTFRYLDNSRLAVETQSASGEQQRNTLSLTSSTPSSEEQDPDALPLFSGDYQRANNAVGHLSGKVELPVESELPDKAVLTVSLLSSDNNTVIRRLMPLTSDADSVPFRLYYPATAVTADNTYQVSSQILSDGGLFFQSEPTPLTVNQNQFADITLPLSAVMTASESLRGALVYQYGTTSLMLCNTDRRLQLAGPQREDLIDAYRGARNYPLQPRVVTVSGLLRKVPGEQEGSTQNGIIVESFSLESRNDNCRLPRADLINTRWQLSALGNEILDPASQQAPYLTLDSEGKVRGHAGCNGLNGSYQHDDDSLSFGAIATTRKACPDMEGEQAFLQALKASRQFRIDGELLTLFDANNQPLAGFQAIAL